MKKIFIVICFWITANKGIAQVQRETNPSQNVVTNSGKKTQKLEMMKSLNLSKEQKGELKESRKNMKQQKEAVNGDSTLTPEHKKQKLKELHKEQNQKLNNILTPDQKEKLREERNNQRMQKDMMSKKDSMQ